MQRREEKKFDPIPNMTVTEILFWTLSVLAVASAINVVVSKNPVFSVLWLILTFFFITCHYVLLNAQFLAIVNMIVYAGAIMVLFLFVIMFISTNNVIRTRRNMWLRIAGIVAGGLMLVVLVAALKNAETAQQIAQTKEGDIGLINYLGMALFNEYVVPFEISSVLFLSAMVGAVVLGKKGD